MIFKKKCSICGAKNPQDARICVSCDAPFELKQTKNQDVAGDYDKVTHLNPQTAEAYYERGLAHRNQGQMERAIEDFDKAIRLNPGFAKAYSSRAHIFLNKQQYDRAVADCNKAISNDPNDAIAYVNRGVAYKQQGNEAEAVANFEKAVTLSNNPQVIKMAEQQIEELSR
ncbi:tetratricopeptide repeat protein [Chloroflexota bacterium]